MDMTFEEFGLFSDFIYGKAGIRFEPKKLYFVSRRVLKRMSDLGMENPSEYFRFLRYCDRTGSEFQNLVESLTINETYFFRNFPQLQSFAEHCLQDVIKEKSSNGKRSLRLWSAGCSTGEEPYTLAIILLEMLENITEWDVLILATDIDRPTLDKARLAEYGERSVKDVPKEYLGKYFDRPSNGTFALKGDVKDMVRFQYLNLADTQALRERQGFDFIFCRNVLIYFDDVSSKQLVEQFYVALNKGGYIFLGPNESIGRITTAFKIQRAGNYLVYLKE